MGEEKTAALGNRGSNRTRDTTSRDSPQLNTKTYNSQEDRHVRRKSQSNTPASQSQNDGGDDQYMEPDSEDDNNDETRDGTNCGDEDDDEHNNDTEGTNNQVRSDGIEENAEDARDNDGVESESESFIETYRTYRTQTSKATRREAEEEFLRTKRELIGLPEEHKRNEGQQKAQRFCTWALRQIKRRIKVLHEEEVARGEDSGSDGLSESDENKMWKMYGVIAEDDTQYLVAWKGTYKKTKQEYGDEWTAKENVEGKAKREWQAYKAKKARGEEL